MADGIRHADLSARDSWKKCMLHARNKKPVRRIQENCHVETELVGSIVWPNNIILSAGVRQMHLEMETGVQSGCAGDEQRKKKKIQKPEKFHHSLLGGCNQILVIKCPNA
jgi:hypothetical protein